MRQGRLGVVLAWALTLLLLSAQGRRSRPARPSRSWKRRPWPC